MPAKLNQVLHAKFSALLNEKEDAKVNSVLAPLLKILEEEHYEDALYDFLKQKEQDVSSRQTLKNLFMVVWHQQGSTFLEVPELREIATQLAGCLYLNIGLIQ